MFPWISSRLFPHICSLCDQVCDDDAGADLCAHCRASLPWNTRHCARCAVPLEVDGGNGTCSYCLVSPPAFARCVAPLRYEAAPRAWVRRLKFHQGLAEAQLLGTLLADAVLARYLPQQLPDVLVPVPVSLRRLAGRGHNQALSLALVIGRVLNLPVSRRHISRIRHGPAQRALSRTARQRNLTDAFACRPWQGERVAVIDDVMTTGATMQALAVSMLAAGAGEVHAWSATRTPATG